MIGRKIIHEFCDAPQERRTPPEGNRFFEEAEKWRREFEAIEWQCYRWEPHRAEASSEHGDDVRETPNAPNVVVIHGWGSCAADMGLIIRHLLKSGFRVTAFDHPGHGLSGGTQTYLPQVVRFVCGLVEEIGDIEALIGHSFGACAAGFTVAKEPLDSPKGVTIKKIVLLNAPETMNDIFLQFLKNAGKGTDRLDEMRKQLESEFELHPDDCTLSEQLKGNEIKALIIHDKNDDQFPFRCGENNAAALNKGEFMITEGLGHGGVITNRAVVKRIAEFLA